MKRNTDSRIIRYLLILSALVTGFISDAQSPYVGINVYSPSTYDPTRPLADAMQSSGDHWKDVDYNYDVPEDANGWPLTDGTIMIWEGLTGNHGTYKLSFNGQATLSQQFNYATFSNISYNAATNITTMDMRVEDTGFQNFILKFTNTKRTASSPLNTGVTNVKLMRPIAPGSTTSYSASTTYTSPYKDAISKYAYYRFMAGTNANQSVNWSDRTRVNENSQNKQLQGEGSEGNGMAWELKVALCNEMNKDMWICIPLKVTDDYIQQLANVIKNGSTVDGVIYAGLNANLKLYVEYSNEVWNFGGADFTQSNDLLTITQSIIDAGNTPLNYDGADNIGVLRFRQQAKRTKEISDIFRSAFGDNQMMSRVRPVLMWQYANYNSSALIPLEFLNNYYNNADGNHVANPHPVNYYIYGAGGATYYQSNNDGANTVDEIYASGIPQNGYQQILEGEVLWAKAYGVKAIAYEGGMGVGGDRTSGARKEARSDPRATAAEVTSYNMFKQAGGDLYTFGTYAQWEDIYMQASSPLQLGIDQINANNPPAVTYGTSVATSGITLLATTNIDLNPGGNASIAFSDNNIMKGYLFRTTSWGSYDLKLRIGNSGSGGKINVFVDGILQGAINIPNTGSSTQDVFVSTLSLDAGQHGIVLKPIGTSNTPDKSGRLTGAILVAGGTGGGDTQAPSVPINVSSSSVGQTGFTLNWSAATDNVGVTGYDVYDGATKLNSSNIGGTSFVVAGLACGTSHNITVRAKDGAGNTSAASAGLNVNTSGCTGGTTIVVRAASIGTGANLTVEVIDIASATGGNVQQTQTVTNVSQNLSDISFNFSGSIPANRFRIRFSNDNNMDLRVDQIVVGGTTYLSSANTTYSVGNYDAGANGCANAGYFGINVLHCNGYFQYNLGTAPITSITIRARSIGAGANATVEIVDAAVATGGTVQQTQTASNISETFTDYTFNFAGTIPANRVRVRFSNDNNNDLEVDYIIVGGTTYQTEATSTYSLGYWGNGANGCSNVGYFGNIILHCNGYFHYNIGNGAIRKGVKDASTNVNIYPNPAKGSFTLNIGEDHQATVQLMDIQGKVIASKEVNGTATFDIAHIGQGVYLININTSDTVVVKRLIVE